MKRTDYILLIVGHVGVVLAACWITADLCGAFAAEQPENLCKVTYDTSGPEIHLLITLPRGTHVGFQREAVEELSPPASLTASGWPAKAMIPFGVTESRFVAEDALGNKSKVRVTWRGR